MCSTYERRGNPAEWNDPRHWHRPRALNEDELNALAERIADSFLGGAPPVLGEDEMNALTERIATNFLGEK